MIKPVFTEKSLAEAKNGKYSFWVGVGMTKPEIKTEISRIFGVHITGIKTVLRKGENKKTQRGMKFSTKSVKKAIVSLKGEEKIDIFEENKKK